MSYNVTAKRWDHGWELHIADVGVTQSASLATAEKTVRSYLAMDDYADAETAEIVIVPELGRDLDNEVRDAREETEAAAAAQKRAALLSRAVVHRLKTAGISGSDVALVLGVSTQRVSQLSKC